MTRINYNTDTLRVGARTDRAGSDAADGAARTLGGASIGASIFGEVAGGGGFAGALGSAQTEHVRSAKAAASSMDNQAGKVDSTAGQGDTMTVETARVADRGTVNRVRDGM